MIFDEKFCCRHEIFLLFFPHFIQNSSFIDQTWARCCYVFFWLFLLTHDNFPPKFSILVRSKYKNLGKLITGHTTLYFQNLSLIVYKLLSTENIIFSTTCIYITEVLKSPKSICFIASCTSKHSIKRIWVDVCIIHVNS